MSTSVASVSPPSVLKPVVASVRPTPPRPSRPQALPPEEGTAGSLVVGLVVTSATLHLLIAGLLGFGVGEERSPRVAKQAEIPPTTIEQRVELEPAPLEEVPETPPLAEELPPELTVPVVADLALPPLPELTPVTAVAPNVPVAFAIAVKGPVRLTDDPARATSSLGGLSGGPVSLDADGQLGRNLILPRLEYPLLAVQRRITGTVDVEFRVSATGGRIADARVRRSSGFTELDASALSNIRRGRWLGAPGYYVKTYSFVLN